ncbi:Glycosyltransferase [Heracleum sosnowskyi]|uniref:Glycosyltransferase n=1 Tax=Heracleum sosnowskyi TaxID=360622 RepID=A0AAD8J161_9APIA|nr:Glycosyltransferase [Heracleum sosnowskyi]
MVVSIENHNIHVVFLPYFTSSHLMPLIDAALVFASRDGVKVSIITTPHNAAMFQSSVDKSISSGHQIAIHSVKFPSEQVNLPEGIESFTTVTSPEQNSKVWQAIELIQKPMENLIRSLSPDCIFSDMCFPWTVDLALELNIPRLMFFASSFFYQCIEHTLKLYAPCNNMVESGTETISIPGLPDNIKMKNSQLPDHISRTQFGAYFKVIVESQTRSYGTVHDTFSELEPAYVDLYQKTICKKSWHIGPLFHFSGRNEVQISRKITSSHQHCLDWLDTQKPKSVVYVCFGSMVKFSDTQSTEIFRALNASNQPFIFVTKTSASLLGDFDENKGSDVWNLLADIKSPVIDKQKIEEAVVRLMGGSGESEIIRQRAKEISVIAKHATEEGGSSYNDLSALIQDIRDLASKKKLWS